MDLYLKKEFIKSVSTFSEAELKKCAIDRVNLIRLCKMIIKKRTANSSTDFLALLNQELINTGQTDLTYLISDDEITTNEPNLKKYLSWLMLISTCVLMPQHKEWVEEHEVMFFRVISKNYTKEQLEKIWLSLQNDARRYDFATLDEVKNTNGFLDIYKTYVKVPCYQLSKNFAKIKNKILTKGYMFIEYESNLRVLILSIIELEWKSIWNNEIDKHTNFLNTFNISILDEIDIFINTKLISDRAAQQTIPTLKLELPKMADDYFPPCMASMLSNFTQFGMLKPDARKQLLLFLQDIGVPKADILDLVRTTYDKLEMIYKKQEDDLRVQHLLGITQQEKLYTSYSCVEIQEHRVLGASTHGCYFKETSKRIIEADLKKLKLSTESKNMIHEKVLEKNYSAACALHFQLKCGLKKAPSTFVTPNDYFNIAKCAHECSGGDIEDLVMGNEGGSKN